MPILVSHASHCEVPCQRQVLAVHASNTLAQHSGAVHGMDTGKHLQEQAPSQTEVVQDGLHGRGGHGCCSGELAAAREEQPTARMTQQTGEGGV